METLAAPAEERTRLPLRTPTAADEAMRTLRLALALPEVWLMAAFGPKVELSVETSNPAGAEAVMSATRLIPETPMIWATEALPAAAEKAVKFPVELMAGAAGLVTVKLEEEVAFSLPTLTRIGPLVAPAGTVAVRLVLLVKVMFVDTVPLKETVALAAKFVPLMVTKSPTAPEAGEKDVMVGAVEEEGVEVTLTSSIDHFGLFPEPLVCPLFQKKNLKTTWDWSLSAEGRATFMLPDSAVLLFEILGTVNGDKSLNDVPLFELYCILRSEVRGLVLFAVFAIFA